MTKYDLLLIPTGSFEQHGPLLGYDTDSLIAETITEKVSEYLKVSNIKLPCIPYGISKEHKDFYLNGSVQSLSYFNYIKDLFLSLIETSNPKLIALINGHGGNINILSAVSNDLNYDYKSKVVLFHIFNKQVNQKAEELFKLTDTHAGTVETSIYYFLKNIQKNEILSNPEYKKKITSGLQLFRTKELTTTGVINDSENVEIDTDKGKKLFNFIL